MEQVINSISKTKTKQAMLNSKKIYSRFNR